MSVKARIAGPCLYPSGAIVGANFSRIAKAVAGWQTGPVGVMPDQPAGTGGGGQQAVAGACLSRMQCAAGALVGQQDQCKAATALSGSHLDAHMWTVNAAMGTLSCLSANSSRLCVTVSDDIKKNVSIQSCVAGGSSAVLESRRTGSDNSRCPQGTGRRLRSQCTWR